MQKRLYYLLLFVGFLIITSSLIILLQRNDSSRLQFDNAQVIQNKVNQKEKTVIGIVIDDIDISLPVIPSYKKGNKWDTTPNGVSYLVSSPLPGENGNSIMYGHNWGSILGNLYKTRVGQIINIYYSDGTKTQFEVEAITEVSPDDSSLLTQTEEKILTIYTCSGLFDQKRLVVTASVI